MRSISVLLVACLALGAAHLALASPQTVMRELEDAWTAFKVKHGRQFESEAFERARREIFLENKKRVELFNEQLSQTAGYKLGLNHMSDWTAEEKAKLNGFKPTNRTIRNSREAEEFLLSILNDPTPVPKELDWRKSPNVVSRVKDQGMCGSCWAFSTTGLLEGQQLKVLKSKKSLIELSEQNLVDCVTVDQGCDGGTMADALTLIGEEGGINDEVYYPYEGMTGQCRFKIAKKIMSDNGPINLPEGDEEALKRMVAKYGPVSVAIDAGSKSFQSYQHGVLDDPDCMNEDSDLNHAVLVVGYGTDKRGVDYWLVKNSWGLDWGDQGYVRMSRNRHNQCGIATAAVVAKF